MLKSLHIQNYALIASLHISFDAGFSVITGETGAGKSIILGALSLILGQRADARHIKQDESKCTVEGVFDISKYELKPFFDEKDWVFDGNECILRREIWTNGKSRAFVNDSPVYLTDLKELGDKLIDIHSQHQNLSLNNNLFQLMVVDILADTATERTVYATAYVACRAAEKELEELRRQSQKNKEEEDYLRFQFAGLTDAALQAGEQPLLEAELEAITHSEEIKSGLFSLAEVLSGDEKGVEQMLRAALDTMRRVERVFPKAADLTARVESAYIDLKDVRNEARRFFDEVDFDPERQQLLESRLGTLYDLQKKHSVATVEELIALRDEIGQKLENIDSLDERLSALQQEVLKKQEVMHLKAEQLSQKRQSAASAIEKQLTEKLAYLGMPNARFLCEFSHKEHPDSTGADDVQFLFSANKNVHPQPVSQIASGGEISRLMLCIKAMIAGATALPTIIFDEIDTGTSGEMADKMGTIMREMAHDMQVVAITHLPQIAVKGSSHYIVYKEDNAETTITNIRKLSSDERVSEIARMLSGAGISAQAVANAKVMLDL